jgi:hypothetical protein
MLFSCCLLICTLSRVLLFVNQKYALHASCLALNLIHVVALILALLLAGLIVDLGGGPDHQRTGFRV